MVDFSYIELEVTHLKRDHLCISQHNFILLPRIHIRVVVMASVIKQMSENFPFTLCNSRGVFFTILLQNYVSPKEKLSQFHAFPISIRM